MSERRSQGKIDNDAGLAKNLGGLIARLAQPT